MGLLRDLHGVLHSHRLLWRLDHTGVLPVTFFRLFLMYRRFGHTRTRSIVRAWETVRRTTL